MQTEESPGIQVPYIEGWVTLEEISDAVMNDEEAASTIHSILDISRRLCQSFLPSTITEVGTIKKYCKNLKLTQNQNWIGWFLTPAQ